MQIRSVASLRARNRGVRRARAHLCLVTLLVASGAAATVIVADSRDGAAQTTAAATGTIAGQVSAQPAKARKNVVVYLQKVTGTFRPPRRPAKMDQRGMQFVPRVLPILTGTTVSFLNSDSVTHNVFSPDAGGFDAGTWPPGMSKTHRFAQEGVHRLLCRMHPEMAAFVVAVQNPYFAVTRADGSFRIQDVPPGTHTLKTWGERLAPATQSVTVAAGQTATVSLTLQSGH